MSKSDGRVIAANSGNRSSFENPGLEEERVAKNQECWLLPDTALICPSVFSGLSGRFRGPEGLERGGEAGRA